MEWVYGLALECWQYFSSSLLSIMSMDFVYLKTHIPIIGNIMQTLMAVGWALLIGNLIFQALKSMASGLGFEGEDPKLLFTRTFVFSFLLMASPQICDIGLNMTSDIIELLQIPDEINVQLVDESVFGTLTAAWLLVIIFSIIIMFKVLKLLLEIAERYVILSMLTITAPLAFSMGGSKNTSEIFTGWCRMFGSMCLLMVTNVVFFKMLLSVLSTVPSGLDVFPWMVLILTIVKVAQKADAIITRIGLNPAITSDSLGRVVPGALSYIVMRTAASRITGAVGKSAGSSGGRGNSAGASSRGSGGSRPSGPVGGHGGTGASGHNQYNASHQSTSQQNNSHQSTSRQNNSQQNSSQQTAQTQDTTYQNSSTQSGNYQTTAQEHTAGSSHQGDSRTGQHSSNEYKSRKSSVPHGTRRSPSRVKAKAAAQSATQTGTAGTTARSAETSNFKRKSSVSEGTSVSGSPSSVRSGAAGTSEASASRMSQVHTQKVQGSPTSSASTTQERTGSAGERPVPGGTSVSRMSQVHTQKMQGSPASATSNAQERTGSAGERPVPGGTSVSRMSQVHTQKVQGSPTSGASTTQERTGSVGERPVPGGTSVSRMSQVHTQKVQGSPTSGVSTTQERTGSVGERPAPGGTSVSHMSQVHTQKVQGTPGDVVVPGSEHTGTSIPNTVLNLNQNFSQDAKRVSPVSPSVGRQQNHSDPVNTRFTQRPVGAETKVTTTKQQSPAAARQTTVPAESVRHDLAGKPSLISESHPVKESRPGRSAASAGSEVPAEGKHNRPNRQEIPPVSSGTVPLSKGTSSAMHHGSAGTAAGDHQTTQVRQTTRSNVSDPTVPEIPSGKNAVPNPKILVKGQNHPPAAVRDTRKKRGNKE